MPRKTDNNISALAFRERQNEVTSLCNMVGARLATDPNTDAEWEAIEGALKKATTIATIQRKILILQTKTHEEQVKARESFTQISGRH